MPEELEVPTEHLHEKLEQAAHAAHHQTDPSAKWVPKVALTAALLAVLAAISALFAGHHANEAVLEQIKASDDWAFYQAKGIKAAVLESRLQLLAALDKRVDEKDARGVERYRSEQEKIKETADEEVRSSKEHLAKHNVLARAVTLFQIAIAMSAIAVLMRRRALWVVSLGLGFVGAGLLGQAFFT